ncbi:MAG TPA: GNAT family N-acetyltransferase [Solirubrobacteraceae bacterium]|nr:GNAT family N-acetyltransferase [Solirubrobacteraceae bacterium]
MSEIGVIAETERVVVRPWRIEEADRYFDIRRRAVVAHWIGRDPLVERAQATAMIELMLEQHAIEPRFGSWAVVERATGVPAGSVVLKPLPDGAGEVEIGWHLHPDTWGRGLATEAGAALLAYGFDLGLDEVWALTHLDNARSARVCEKLGMRLLGITQRWYHEPSLMFWAGAAEGQEPSFGPDLAAPP